MILPLLVDLKCDTGDKSITCWFKVWYWWQFQLNLANKFPTRKRPDLAFDKRGTNGTEAEKQKFFFFFFFLEKCNKSTNTNIQIYKYIRLVLQVWINWIPRFNFQFQQRFYLGHVTSLCGLGPHHLSIIVMNVNRIMVFQGLSLCFATFAISFLPSISNTPLS